MSKKELIMKTLIVKNKQNDTNRALFSLLKKQKNSHPTKHECELNRFEYFDYLNDNK